MAGNKRIVIIFILAMLTGLLTGCGKKEYVVEYGVDGYVYPARRLIAMEGVNDLRVIGDYLYYIQDTENSASVRRVSIAAMISGEGGLDFSKQETLVSFSRKPFLLPEGTPENIEDIDFLALLESESYGKGRNMELGKRYGMFPLAEYAVDSEGNLYYYLEASIYYDFNMEDGGGILCKQTPDGQQVYRIHLPEITGIAVNGDGNAFVLSKGQILVLNQEGRESRVISTEEYCSMDNEPEESLFMDSEKRIYYCTRNGQNIRKTYEIEEGTFRLKDAGEILGNGSMRASASSNGNIFLIGTESVLYEYDRASGSREKILNWVDSGLMSYAVRSVVRITQDILLVNYSGSAGEEGIYQLTRTPVEELPEKELLVIASPVSSEELERAVMLFNMHNDAYRIVLDSYGSEYSDEENRWICTRLDAALVSANPPDILNLASLNIVKYAEKEVLEDLTPYIESNGTLDLNDIPDNLMSGLTFDGRLVCLPISFNVKGAAVRKSQAENFDCWTMEDVYRLSEQHPESIGQLVNDGYGKNEKTEWLLEEFCAHYYLEKFVDWEEGKCSFDSEEFCKLLEWAGTYGWKPEQEAVSTGSTVSRPEYISDEVMLISRNWINFETLAYLEIQLGEEACLMGYPSANGEKYFPARIDGGLGIVAGSSHKEAAWEFLEYYRQVCSNQLIGRIPSSKVQLARMYENISTEEYLGQGLDGEPKMRVKGYLIAGDDSFTYDVIPKEQADAVLEALETADFTPLSEAEEMIIKIVTEEAESYYNGDKSLEEVTAIIQNRAGLVLKERQ